MYTIRHIKEASNALVEFHESAGGMGRVVVAWNINKSLKFSHFKTTPILARYPFWAFGFVY